MNNTLSGIRVVELSTFIAVPACARFFADLGAEVVKIEAASGDAVRWNGTSEGRPDDPYENTTFDLENANKRGVVLNLKAPEGKELLFRLLSGADKSDRFRVFPGKDFRRRRAHGDPFGL